MVTLDNVLSILLCAFEHIVWKTRFTNKLLLLLLLLLLLFCHLKGDLGLGRPDCQHAVRDEFLYTVAGCALGTVVSLCV